MKIQNQIIEVVDAAIVYIELDGENEQLPLYDKFIEAKKKVLKADD